MKPWREGEHWRDDTALGTRAHFEIFRQPPLMTTAVPLKKTRRSLNREGFLSAAHSDSSSFERFPSSKIWKNRDREKTRSSGGSSSDEFISQTNPHHVDDLFSAVGEKSTGKRHSLRPERKRHQYLMPKVSLNIETTKFTSGRKPHWVLDSVPPDSKYSSNLERKFDGQAIKSHKNTNGQSNGEWKFVVLDDECYDKFRNSSKCSSNWNKSYTHIHNKQQFSYSLTRRKSSDQHYRKGRLYTRGKFSFPPQHLQLHSSSTGRRLSLHDILLESRQIRSTKKLDNLHSSNLSKNDPVLGNEFFDKKYDATSAKLEKEIDSLLEYQNEQQDYLSRSLGGLKLKNVRISDHGKYTCRVEYGRAPTSYDTIMLFVVCKYR